MGTILAIARREVKRLRSGFGGSSRPVVAIVLIGALLISFLAFRQGFVLTRGIYRVGVSPGGPGIHDGRFYTTVVDPAQGYEMLRDGALDLYVDGEVVAGREGARSVNAAGALKRYLEKRELARIADLYELGRAFPLRIEVNYLPTAAESVGAPGALSMADLMEAFSRVTTNRGAAEAGPAGDTSVDTSTGTVGGSGGSDSAVREQLWEMQSGGGGLVNIEMEIASDKEILVPSR